MPDIQISSTDWLAVSLRNGTAGVFNLNDTRSWQHLQSKSIADQTSEINLSSSFMKFSPNGQILVFNGPDKQVNVYMQADFEQTEVWWQLKRIIIVKQSISALDLTNGFVLLSDSSGDIYKVDLSFNDTDQYLVLSEEYRIMEHSSMLLDMVLILVNEKKSFLITADQVGDIRLRHYPNVSHSPSYCLGHTEFVSHLKLIGDHQILSASGDGTLRLWRLPDCAPLVFLHSKVFTLLSKQIFYTQLFHSENLSVSDDYRIDAMSEEPPFDSSSTINYSIWNLDVASYDTLNSNVYIAFSTYAHRSHSIYLTSLTNMKELNSKQRKLTLDSSYGVIVDFCFPSKEVLLNDHITSSKCFLYILFDSNTLLKVNILSVFSCNKTELFDPSDETTQEINTLLASKEFHSIDCGSNDISSDDILYKQLCNNGDTTTVDNSYSKRKIERIEQEQQRKKPACLQNE